MKKTVQWWALSSIWLALPGCQGDGVRPGSVQIDTLANGHVLVQNGQEGLWSEQEGWRVVEELRIGSIDAEGPETFARIPSLTVDGAGRIWVLDSQAAELRGFDSAGLHIRTIGQAGEGPGEFGQPLRVDISPDGDIWVMDPGNARLSIFAPEGGLERTVPFGGGLFASPWRGGFDRNRRYYSPVLDSDAEVRIRFGVFQDDLTPVDTIDSPVDPVQRGSWRIVSEDGGARMTAGIPFQGRLVWNLSPDGTIWALITDEYRLIELGLAGDTLRTVTKASGHVPVSAEERAEAIENMRWFTDQGGRIDPAEIPSHKPSVNWFFLDEFDHIWVARTDEAGLFDVFDPVGRFLGAVTMPFGLQEVPTPIVRDGLLYGVVEDEYGVQYVVRARLER